MDNTTNCSITANKLRVLEKRTSLENAAIAVAVSVLAIVAILGNGIVIGLVLKDRLLRKQASNVLLTYLASVDMVTAVGTMIPTIIAVVADEWPFSDFWCRVHGGFNYWGVGGTQLTICLLTVDRFISVWRPLQYRTIVTHKRMILALLPVLILGSMCAIRPVVDHWVVYDYNELACNVDWNRPGIEAWVNSMWGILFVLPSVIIVTSNIYIVVVARSSYNSLSLIALTPYTMDRTPADIVPQNSIAENIDHVLLQDQSSSLSSHYVLRVLSLCYHCVITHPFHVKANENLSPLRNRVYYSVFIVTVCFFVCLTPFSMVKVIKMWTGDAASVSPSFCIFSTILQYSNSCLNPFIYGILRPDFRRAFRKFRNSYLCRH